MRPPPRSLRPRGLAPRPPGPAASPEGDGLGLPRRRRREYRYKHVRLVGHGAVQARVWVGPTKRDGWGLNLGCFGRAGHADPERAAALLAREFLRRAARPGVDWLDVLAAMRAEGKTRALPRWVRPAPGGGFFALRRAAGRVTRTRVHDTPERAYRAMLARLRRIGG